jgi:Thioredoxin-like
MVRPITMLFAVLLTGIGILQESVCLGQAQDSRLKWKRNSSGAVAEARQTNKGVLVFFHEASSVVSIRLWKSLCSAAAASEIEQRYVPVFIDMETDKALAEQLKIKEAGTLVIYDSKGTPVAMLKESEVSSPEILGSRLRSIASERGLGASAGSTGAPSASSAPQKPAAPSNGQASSGSNGREFPNSLAPEQVVRDQHLGKDIAVTGRIVVFEASSAVNRPYILTLTKRAEDPLQVVYWQQAADSLHRGLPMPREGDLVSVKGKLTDYRGRLQFKVEQADQLRFLQQP